MFLRGALPHNVASVGDAAPSIASGGEFWQHLAPTLPPLGEFQTIARWMSSPRSRRSSVDIARYECSAVDVAWHCCSAVDVAWPCCSAVVVARLCCSAVDVVRRLRSAVDVALDPLALPSEKIERICQTFTSAPTSSTSHSQHSTTPSLTQLSTVAAEEVLQIIRSCNPTTCPLDPIPSAMLQTISPDLLPFITTVINGSLTSGHVPTVFKKARVIPVLKKPALDPSDISNYRPVSLLSFLSKILKCVVCNQLSDYLMQNNLHDPNQSGFKAAHSRETALLAVTEKLHAARSAKLSSVLFLLELSAAFDTVNHKTLLSTLSSLGICGTAWEWFASHMDGRSYQVTWKGLTSAPRRLSTGVPQGSVLGPLLCQESAAPDAPTRTHSRKSGRAVGPVKTRKERGAWRGKWGERGARRGKWGERGARQGKWGERGAWQQGHRVPSDVHRRAEKPSDVHRRAEEPSDIHRRAEEPSNVHRRAEEPSNVHRQAEELSDVHR
ncbi:hypothetical protein QTP86_000966 [Hemibagrus guttatus]|nr:hypothetical protein QTP86_000966 [Hemibagrus guttatus]